MSNFRIVKEVPKSAQKSRCDQYGKVDFFNFIKIVTIFFPIFASGTLGTFLSLYKIGLMNQKNPSEFFCEKCDYLSCRKSQYIRHLSTTKHKMIVNSVGTINKPPGIFECICGKTYKYDSGYYRHKKTCDMASAATQGGTSDTEETAQSLEKPLENTIIASSSLAQEQEQDLDDEDAPLDLDKVSEKEMLMLFMKEMKSTMLEMFKHLQPVNNTTSNNIHNNSHNKTFNLQFFLNEQCKDALNINEFVDSIKVQLSDLEDTGRLGYVDGISKIILKNLQDMRRFKRPIHCSDVKREVIYIKKDDEWIKDDENNEQMKNAIRQVTNKNIRQIAAWAEAHPNCRDPRSKKNDQYLRIVSNAMSGISSEEQSKNMMQIIRNVAREVVIEK